MKKTKSQLPARPRLTASIVLPHGETPASVRRLVQEYLDGCTVEHALRAICEDAIFARDLRRRVSASVRNAKAESPETGLPVPAVPSSFIVETSRG